MHRCCTLDTVVPNEVEATGLNFFALECGECGRADDREREEIDHNLERLVIIHLATEGTPQPDQGRRTHQDKWRARDEHEPRQVSAEPRALHRRGGEAQVDLDDESDGVQERFD
eukprot:7379925-Prymnesium_polylepis.2